jgi:hypothetical protein
VAEAVEANEPAHPAEVRLFGARAVVPLADQVARLLEQLLPGPADRAARSDGTRCRRPHEFEPWASTTFAPSERSV